MATILVVDDAAIVRHVWVRMLSDGGHTVVGEGASGDAAVELCASLRPDVVVLDVTMPHGDGIAAAKRIRATDPDVAIVLASVLVDAARRERAHAAGVREFVTKPVEAADLLAAVERALAAPRR